MALGDKLNTGKSTCHAPFLLQLSPLGNICIYGKIMSVHTYTLTDERSVLLLDLCATRGMATCEDEAGNWGMEGKERSFTLVLVLQKTTQKFSVP